MKGEDTLRNPLELFKAYKIWNFNCLSGNLTYIIHTYTYIFVFQTKMTNRLKTKMILIFVHSFFVESVEIKSICLIHCCKRTFDITYQGPCHSSLAAPGRVGLEARLTHEKAK